MESVLGPRRALRALSLYGQFRSDLRAYRSLPGAEPIESADLWPFLFDKTDTTPFDAQYFYQDSWAARRILATHPPYHVDVGSRVDFAGILSAAMPIIFLDIRPLVVSLSNFRSVAGSILQLPFADGGLPSLSCLHVIEHIGLGRYGDPFDPEGTKKAARELGRVLAVGGSLFVGVPVGRERVCFNAHRVHSPQTILRYFEDLTLVEFSCLVGEGIFHEGVDPYRTDLGKSACGLFWFKKERSRT
ncbi:MAG: DUF268 domain-containing protein [Candidatus Brocadiae bacterium]|nr:DUF268 domain-containing protein [Candidatus Brocadiia bacterium]